MYQYNPSKLMKIIKTITCIFRKKYRLEIEVLKLRNFEKELEALYRNTITSLQDEIHEVYTRSCSCEWNKELYREKCKEEFGKQILEKFGVK
jgi:predicted nucleotidyltransferase